MASGTLLAATGAACWAAGGPEAGLFALAGGAAAAVAVATLGEARPETRHEPREPSALDIKDLTEAIAQPILIVRAARIESANRAARTLLGDHIVGDDVRVAIRHPAAAERLSDEAPGDGPVDLVGLGARDSHWLMRIASVGPRRIVQLSDETGAFAAERMRVDFVANASHELRTPLASILGYIETLGDEAGEDPAVRGRFLSIMEREAHRMQRLVSDLISLSRIEAEKYRVPDTPIDLASLVREVAVDVAAAREDAPARLALDLVDGATVAGDRAQLSQMLHNLIGNALKYGRAGGQVAVTVATPSDRLIRLSVVDEGDGVDAEHLPRLTERFYRVDPGRSRAGGGTGLGLAIVKHIVERHRGRLSITSRRGVGTTVSVLLPVRSDVVTKA